MEIFTKNRFKVKFFCVPFSLILLSAPVCSLCAAAQDDCSAKDTAIVNKLESLLTEHELTARKGAGPRRAKSAAQELTKDELSYLALTEMNKSANEESFYTLKNAFYVTDFSDNPYLFASYSPFGFSVVSAYNYETVELDFFDETDYSEYSDDDNCKYIPTAGLFSFDGERYDNAQSGYSFPVENSYVAEENSCEYLNNLEESYSASVQQKINLLTSVYSDDGGDDEEIGEDGRKSWDIDVNKRVVTANLEVPHSWFFKFNTNQFSYHEGDSGSGICEYIAFLLMMSYHDFFSCAGYFSDEEIAKYVTKRPSRLFENTILEISDKWCYDLYEQFGKKESLTTSNLNDLTDMFMQNKSVKYRYASAYTYFGGTPSIIIREGRPDMISGFFPSPYKDQDKFAHNIVAYGYFSSGEFSGKYLTHYGWRKRSQCIISRSVTNIIYDWSIQNLSEHVHRRIFQFGVPDYGSLEDYCGCEIRL